MPSSSRNKASPEKRRRGREPRDFTQLGLDFMSVVEYSIVPRKEIDVMNQELFETLDNKVGALLEKYAALKDENARLTDENQRFQAEREGLKSRIDAILGKLEGI